MKTTKTRGTTSVLVVSKRLDSPTYRLLQDCHSEEAPFCGRTDDRPRQDTRIGQRLFRSLRRESGPRYLPGGSVRAGGRCNPHNSGKTPELREHVLPCRSGVRAFHRQGDPGIAESGMASAGASPSSPQFSPSFCCGGPMARPLWLSLARAAQRSVGFACAALGRESQPYRTLLPRNGS
jgi:hypothetical protein